MVTHKKRGRLHADLFQVFGHGNGIWYYLETGVMPMHSSAKFSLRHHQGSVQREGSQCRRNGAVANGAWRGPSPQSGELFHVLSCRPFALATSEAHSGTASETLRRTLRIGRGFSIPAALLALIREALLALIREASLDSLQSQISIKYKRLRQWGGRSFHVATDYTSIACST